MKTFYGLALALVLALTAMAVGTDAATALAYDGGQRTHTVALGETLYSIARRYGVSAEAIAAANGVVNLDYIYAGQTLTIPGSGPSWEPAPAPQAGGGRLHRVSLGETLYGIAWKYGVSVPAIMAANGLSNPDYIYAGQDLRIPGGWAPEPAPGGGWTDPGPGCGHRHPVKPGETLSGIAWHHGLSIGAIARANGIGFPYLIYAGQALYIPCGEGGLKPGHGHHEPQPKPRPQHPHPTARPDLRPAACAREVQIVNPRQGEHVTGTVNVAGTANIADFQFYKLEAAMGATPLDGNFFSIGEEVNRTVNDSSLGTWYVGNLPAGTWTLRLTAVDNRGQFPRPCNVTVHVDR